jgi:hypothetical protein
MPAAAPADADSGENGPPVEEILPRVFRQNMQWVILALALAILSLGFILLYRTQPAAASPVIAAKGKNEHSRP